MIHHTFSILQGIGDRTERDLWSRGLLTWDDFRSAPSVRGLSASRKDWYDTLLARAAEHLEAGDADYFGRLMSTGDHWRLFDAFRGRVVCLDIETSGLSPDAGGYVTMVGLYDGSEFTALTRGRDLSAESVMERLDGCGLLVTFFGASFDVPFLLKTLPGVEFAMPHFDLCFGARRIGMKGGLKKIEPLFGIERGAETEGMDGYDAVRLWQQGTPEAIDKLIAYNREDTVNLMTIAPVLYERLRESTGILEHLSGGRA